ncbi:Down syndrome cell adhesion molecule-like protein Dscam2 [Centruroides sculpturatus]|uniref:Down syndrome cell adhesion molecule-like protein Dscam2 n=1 Tax=Centruroides sculpturatus TaxID=218467 RepID=UPI000C6D495E|nr:Down syndrome cell adhesion molecule-like protein Dscam2 [Centruroides sculpturatus]
MMDMGSVLIQLLILTTHRVLCASSATEIQNGPTFINEPPSHVDFHNTTGTVISCSAQGTPTPLVFWTSQDGTPLREIPGLRHVRPDGSLVFPPFRAEDYRQDVHDDIYRCVASNSVGNIFSREVQVRAGM